MKVEVVVDGGKVDQIILHPNPGLDIKMARQILSKLSSLDINHFPTLCPPHQYIEYPVTSYWEMVAVRRACIRCDHVEQERVKMSTFVWPRRS